MALVLKYIERTKTGTFQYRRRVPKALAGIITKREFKKKLGDSEREALKAWPGVHAEFEREIDSAHARIATGQSAARPSATEREAYAEALRYRADLIEAGTPEKI